LLLKVTPRKKRQNATFLSGGEKSTTSKAGHSVYFTNGIVSQQAKMNPATTTFSK